MDKRHGFSPLLGPFRNASLTAFRGDIHLIKAGRISKLISIYSWVNYNELTTTSLEIIVSKGKYPQIALIQVSELLPVVPHKAVAEVSE